MTAAGRSSAAPGSRASTRSMEQVSALNDVVLRDPATQALVAPEQALRGTWRQLDLSGTYWDVTLDLYAKQGKTESTVLVAPRRAKNFSSLLSGLQRLREAGVAA